MLNWNGNDHSMKMRETSRAIDKKLLVNNNLLKHLCHAHIKFFKGEEVYENGFLMGNISKVNLEKSKLSPKFIDIPCYINASNGGKIDEIDSLIRYMISDKVGLIQAGAWYKIDNLIDSMSARYPQLIDTNTPDCDVIEPLRSFKKSYRKAEFYDVVRANPDLVLFFQIALIDFIDDIYPMQRDVNGDYQKQLMCECAYFNNQNNQSNDNDDYNDIEDEQDIDDVDV